MTLGPQAGWTGPMADVVAQLGELLAADRVVAGSAASDDLYGDESLTVEGRAPAVVVFPESTDEVAAVLRLADADGIPVTARGAGTGLSGAAVPAADGIVVCFDRMNQVLEIDTENHVAVVQPGVRLNELDEALAQVGLVYPVYPGEYSASLGGNVNTPDTVAE